MQPGLVDRHPVVLLGCLVALAAAVRAALASQIPTPWIFVDELVHSDLARSFEEHGRFLVRGDHVTVSFLYPVLIAPAWAARQMSTTYTLAKTINAVAMSLAAVPVYLWGRRFVSVRGALVAAALTLCLPVYVLTGTLMTENAFLPMFLLSLYAISLALERPTLLRHCFVALAVALTVATRVQGLTLVLVLASAVAMDALLARSWRPALAFWPLGVAVALAAAAYVAAKLASGNSVFALGVYAGVRTAGYSAGSQAKWLAYSAGELALVLGVIPLCALGALLVRARDAQRAERAFLAVAAPAVVWSLLLGALSAAWEPVGLKERYMIHAAPAAFLALVLWIERGAPRGRTAIVLAAAAVALVAVLPLASLFAEPSLVGNAFGLIPFQRIAHAVGAARAIAVIGAVAAALVFVLLPRRLLPFVPAVLAVFLLASSIPVFTTFRSQARAARDRAAYHGDPTWIDEAAGRKGHVAFLNTANFEPETLQGRIVEAFEPVWEAEFWNRSFRKVISLGVQEPAPLPQEATVLDWADGRIVGLRSPYVLARPRFQVAGRPLGRRGDLELFRTAGPVRLDSAIEGLDASGTATGTAALSGWRPVRRVLVYSSGPALVTAGTLEPSPGGGARIARVTGKRAIEGASVVELPLPRPPYRVEVKVSKPPAHVEFDLGRA
jgi:hypothetical protein